jgi:L-histidine Nalpha-methyltransferase / hercynylcysteine S-oxide synthase
LEEQVFNLDDWKVIGEYVYDGEGGRHQAFYSPVKDVHYKDVYFKAGERVQVEQSLKYSAEETRQLWRASGLSEVGRWSASSEAYSTSRLLSSSPSFSSALHEVQPFVYEALATHI